MFASLGPSQTNQEDISSARMSSQRSKTVLTKEERIIESLVDQLNNNFPLFNIGRDRTSTQEEVMSILHQYIMSSETPDYELIFKVFRALKLGTNVSESATTASMEDEDKASSGLEETSWVASHSLESDQISKPSSIEVSQFDFWGDEFVGKRWSLPEGKKKLKRQTSLLDKIFRKARSTESSKNDDVCNLLKRLSKHNIYSPSTSSADL